MAGYKEYCKACKYHSHVNDSHFCYGVEGGFFIWRDNIKDSQSFPLYERELYWHENWMEECPLYLEYLVSSDSK